MIKDIQCRICKFGNSVKQEEVGFVIFLTCSEYKKGIPDYVEEVEKDCPKFEVK